MMKVLISGAGVAGSTLAWFLSRRGHAVTLVERSEGQRSSGNPVDVRGPAIEVAQAMGLMPRLREVATHARAMTLLRPDGRPVARVPMGARDELEVQRADLAATLLDAARESSGVHLLWDDTITALQQDDGGVDVTFDRNGPDRFDLVIGADGLHSAVRRLTFGDEGQFAQHLGLWVATVALGQPSGHPHDVLLHNTPGRLLSVHPARGNAIAAFIWRGPELAHAAYRDPEQQQRLLSEAFSDTSWRTPELLQHFHDASASGSDVYFDAVSKVSIETWSRGRIALLGDAASCVSLFGDGSSLAMAGAATLARALAESTSHSIAFARYERGHRVPVAGKQRGIGAVSHVLVPRTSAGLAVRNLAARALPIMSVGQHFVSSRTGSAVLTR